MLLAVVYLSYLSYQRIIGLKEVWDTSILCKFCKPLSFTCEKFSGGSQGPRRCEYFSPQSSLCLMVLIPRRIWIRLVANVSRCESVIGSKLRNKVMANKSWITVLVWNPLELLHFIPIFIRILSMYLMSNVVWFKNLKTVIMF